MPLTPKTKIPHPALCACGLAACLSSPVFADDISASDPQPDRSSYTLFNPVPEDERRSFSTDRPSKSASPYTVDAGHFQYEADLVNWTYDRYTTARMTTSGVVAFDPTFKAGLTQNTDLEMALAPVNFEQSRDRVTGTQNTASGFGDIYTRLKYNLFGNDGGDYVMAITPYVKAPAAAHAIGNGHWEGGAYAPLAVTLPHNWVMVISTELDILENADLNGMHPNYQNLINFSHPVFSDKITGTVEFWSDVNTDRDTPTQYTVDLAAAWMVTDNVQLDAGVNIGVNKAANDLQPYLGLSQRF